MIGSRIALLTLASLSSVMAAGLFEHGIVDLTPEGVCYKAAALVVSSEGDAKKDAQKEVNKLRDVEASKKGCDAGAKVLEDKIAEYNKANTDQNEAQKKEITKQKNIASVMKGGSSSMLLIIIIIAAVLIVGGVLVYCFCCRSSSSASDDDL